MSTADLRVIARVLKPFHRTHISGMPKSQLKHLLGSVGGYLPGGDNPRHWIHKAIKRPGAFRKFAAEHNGLDARGKIDPNFIKHIIANPPSVRIKREAVLARTLRGFHGKGVKGVTGGRGYSGYRNYGNYEEGGCFNPDSKSCPTNIFRRRLQKIKTHSK